MCAGTDELTVVSTSQDRGEDPQGGAGLETAQSSYDEFGNYLGWQRDTRQGLSSAGLYPSREAAADFGTEEERAENTLRIVQFLPHLEAADVYAVFYLVCSLTAARPSFRGHRLCHFDGRQYPPASGEDLADWITYIADGRCPPRRVKAPAAG